MAFKPIYILILASTIVIDYFAGLALEKESSTNRKKAYLIVSLIANISILVVFKYWNFLADNFNGVFHFLQLPCQVPFLEIVLPIGLSFHTFQAMSYTIEVYRGNQKAERHFGIYALYVMFYPQLVAGPIERPQNILHQFHLTQKFSYSGFKTGIFFIMLGIFKKVFIADRLGGYVDSYYNNIEHLSFIPTVSAIIFYSFQIYCDFSGYSTIAIGTAKCMGFNLMVNFNKPYQASTVTDFWRRWHISLSTWFRDYVYIPLGGNRVPKWKMIRNTSIVFLLSGLWHGANWTFIIWGGIHAMLLILENQLLGSKIRSIKPSFWRQIVVFIFVAIAWIFFRSQNFGQAYHVLKMFIGLDIDTNISQVCAMLSPLNTILCWLCIPLVFIIDNTRMSTYRKNPVTYLVSATLLIILLGKSNEAAFIYFQF